MYIYGKFKLFYVSGEEIVEKDARMSLLRLFEHIDEISPFPRIMGFGRLSLTYMYMVYMYMYVKLSHCLREAGLQKRL